MIDNWSTESVWLHTPLQFVEHPVMVFLSDGESSIQDKAVRRSLKPLSFHAVFFGPDGESSSNSRNPSSDQNSPVSTLRNMVHIALEIQNRAPPDPLLPTAARIPSSFNTALDTVHLAETFMRIAESLRKPRGSLMSL
ncbi:hypothetical protein EDB85DRAFT_1962012 [Lactarius pseudohatsudake]|nr:hypothetical protein EDB85DRAFT_1962012 [Lactarius pseudohatsudake]